MRASSASLAASVSLGALEWASPLASLPGVASPGASSFDSVILASFGGAKVPVDRRAKSILEKPASTMALPPSDGATVNFSGVPVSASTAMRTALTVEPESLGVRARR